MGMRSESELRAGQEKNGGLPGHRQNPCTREIKVLCSAKTFSIETWLLSVGATSQCSCSLVDCSGQALPHLWDRPKNSFLLPRSQRAAAEPLQAVTFQSLPQRNNGSAKGGDAGRRTNLALLQGQLTEAFNGNCRARFLHKLQTPSKQHVAFSLGTHFPS